MPASEMMALYRAAGIDEALVKEIPGIVKNCHVCRQWQSLPPKQVAKAALALSFNEKVWGDLFFSTCYCEGQPRDLSLIHI